MVSTADVAAPRCQCSELKKKKKEKPSSSSWLSIIIITHTGRVFLLFLLNSWLNRRRAEFLSDDCICWLCGWKIHEAELERAGAESWKQRVSSDLMRARHKMFTRNRLGVNSQRSLGLLGVRSGPLRRCGRLPCWNAVHSFPQRIMHHVIKNRPLQGHTWDLTFSYRSQLTNLFPKTRF